MPARQHRSRPASSFGGSLESDLRLPRSPAAGDRAVEGPPEHWPFIGRERPLSAVCVGKDRGDGKLGPARAYRTGDDAPGAMRFEDQIDGHRAWRTEWRRADGMVGCA